MTNSEVIPAELLQRKAVVYVRQSSPAQVLTNLESQRLQYDLVRIARQRGFWTLRSSMTIWVVQQTVWYLGQGLTGCWDCYALAK
jgi:hypothetical protein